MFSGEKKGKKERKKERKEKKENERKGKKEKGEVIFPGFWVLSTGREQKTEGGVRSSTFSLRFTEIGPLVLVGPRVKAHLLGECYA